MAEYHDIPRLPTSASAARRRRFNTAFQPGGSGAPELVNIAERILLADLLSVITITAGGLEVAGTISSGGVNTNTITVNTSITADSLVVNTAIVANSATIDTLNANTINLGGLSLDPSNPSLFGTTAFAFGQDHTVTSPERFIIANTTGDDHAITLPAANTYENTAIYIKRIGAAGGSLLVHGVALTEPTTVGRSFQSNKIVFQGTVAGTTYQISSNIQVSGGVLMPGTFEKIDGASNTTLASPNDAISLLGRLGKWYVLNYYSA